MIKSVWQERGRDVLVPTVGVLAKAGINPTTVTLLGLFLNIACGFTVGLGHPTAGGIVLILAGLCDALDGQLARRTGRVSRFGAFLDSSVDRIDETAVLAGIAGFFQRIRPDHAEALVVFTLLALAGSLITSYVRARAEALGFDCKVGVFERPERVLVVITGLLIGPRALAAAIILVFIFSWFTVVQRIEHVRRLENQGGPRPPGVH